MARPLVLAIAAWALLAFPAAGHGEQAPDLAGRLCISGETVRVHLQHIYRKLGVKNRVELIRSLTSRPPKLADLTWTS